MTTTGISMNYRLKLHKKTINNIKKESQMILKATKSQQLSKK